jgi:two-component system, chemotaxis family, chemotaxis protein CheY
MTHGGVANGVILGDDDLLVRGIISSILRHAGQQVFPACDGVEAVNLAQQFQARLVPLDINMPRLNGLLAFKAIRAIPAYGNVPIVMLTAYTDIRMRLAAEALGANGYITKPFRPDDLLLLLATCLDGSKQVPLGVRTQPPPGCLRGQVWKRGDDLRLPSDADRRSGSGCEVLRIVRDAERNEAAAGTLADQ